jgi:hypothetical protein
MTGFKSELLFFFAFRNEFHLIASYNNGINNIDLKWIFEERNGTKNE